MAPDRRLARLRALVDRIERLPASAHQEWMLQEARARMVDVETGVEPRPMRTLHEEPPVAPSSPQASPAPNGRTVKQPASKPAHAATTRVRPQPEGSTRERPLPLPEPGPSRNAEPGPRAAMAGDAEVIWLDDQPDHTVTEPGDGSGGIAPWRRGLRG